MKMSESFKILIGYSTYLTNILNYDTWKDEEIGKKFREKEKTVKKGCQKKFLENEIDFSELSEKELQLLGFSTFNESCKNLIPPWIFRLLPNNTRLVSFNGEMKIKKDADDDVRFGVTAYRLMGKMDYEV